MTINHDNKMVECTVCGRRFLPYYVKKNEPYICWVCKDKADREKERDRIASGYYGENYEPLSTDDGYYCPYCGVFIENDDYHLCADGLHDVECPCCGKQFEIDVFTSITFTSRRCEK